MTDSGQGRVSQESATADHSQSNNTLAELRSLLFAPEQNQIEELQERLDNPALHAKEVSRVLPDAILLRSRQDPQLAKSLTPIIEEAFTHSVKKSPNVIIDIISPVMGPAIRKAIFTALRGMMQSLNQTLEHSVSWRGLQWRIEGWRTGKPFAEIVLLHTLRFRVEQVFLIHNETGLLLHHVSAESVPILDEDVISGMLTAIQDFVHDSFGGRQADTLDSLHVGELTVWVVQGPKAVLAGVIRGTPQPELRTVFQEVIETVHVQLVEVLDSFQGDTAPFEAARPHLEECLQAQFERKSQKPSPLLWVMLAVCLLLLGVWGFFAFQEHQRWARFLNRVESEPGLIVTSFGKEGGTPVVFGLRDPLSPEPTVLASEAGLDSDSIIFRLEPYFALSPDILRRRAITLLQPPASVKISVEDSRLIASGTASHHWIAQLQALSNTIPGIATIEDDHLIDTDLKRLDTLKGQIEQQEFQFSRGNARLFPTAEQNVVALSTMIQELDQLTEFLGKKVRVEIRGHTSRDGSAIRNRQLSLARAKAVLSALSPRNLKASHLVPGGVEASDSLTTTKQGVDPSLNRRVSFRVIVEEGGRRDTVSP